MSEASESKAESSSDEEMPDHGANEVRKTITPDEKSETPPQEDVDEADEEADSGGSDSKENSGSESEHEDDGEETRRSRFGRKIKAPVRYTYLTVEPYDRGAAEQKHLRIAYGHFQGGQFYARQAPFLPHYLLEKAYQVELDKNWVPNMVEVPIEQVTRDSNIIGSHFA